MARTLAAAGKNQEALAEFREIAANLPESPSAHLDLGVMFLTMSQPDDAIKELERALQLDEKCGPAYLQLGRAREAKGDLEGAKKAYDLGRSLPSGPSQCPD